MNDWKTWIGRPFEVQSCRHDLESEASFCDANENSHNSFTLFKACLVSLLAFMHIKSSQAN